jgi:hypothetical protein
MHACLEADETLLQQMGRDSRSRMRERHDMDVEAGRLERITSWHEYRRRYFVLDKGGTYATGVDLIFLMGQLL